jgi:glutamyl-tRNA synthetase
MTETIIQKITDLLTEAMDLETRAAIEARNPLRNLPASAEVMRVPPSPTGFVHIGTIYAGLINERIAHQTGGVFILRIEDTDKKREVAGSTDAILSAFKAFGLNYDEGPGHDSVYGPYFQSQRATTYMTYAIELLKSGRAYPCFATPEELQANTKKQQTAKVRPGYYGQWALWRDRADDEITAALNAGKPFVLRFQSAGNHDTRITYEDVFKGHMEVPQNDLDVPLIKSDGTRLPTYHLAHIVDDFLMRTTKVFRSDEWLPSTALHIELAQALGIQPFNYGHFAPISIIDKNGGGKRKLSKRKDPEADVQFWLKAGYPIEGIKAYLLGLANSNFEDWYRANPSEPLTSYKISLQKLSASRAPLLDMAKLEDYCKEYIAALPQDEFEKQLNVYATRAGLKVMVSQIAADRDYAHQVFMVERSGDKPRKDLAKWDDVHSQYGYFFDELYKLDFEPLITAELATFAPDLVSAACQAFLKTYDAADDQTIWFDKLKAAATDCGFATDNKDFKNNPQNYKGNVADFAKIIRVKLTGKNRTPDLCTIMQVMGLQRVKNRLH